MIQTTIELEKVVILFENASLFIIIEIFSFTILNVEWRRKAMEYLHLHKT